MICTIYSLHELVSSATDWIVSENSRIIFFQIHFWNLDQEVLLVSPQFYSFIVCFKVVSGQRLILIRSYLGGTPYPTINNRELLRLLKTGYRMEKPEICNDEMYVMTVYLDYSASHVSIIAQRFLITQDF